MGWVCQVGGFDVHSKLNYTIKNKKCYVYKIFTILSEQTYVVGCHLLLLVGKKVISVMNLS